MQSLLSVESVLGVGWISVAQQVEHFHFDFARVPENDVRLSVRDDAMLLTDTSVSP